MSFLNTVKLKGFVIKGEKLKTLLEKFISIYILSKHLALFTNILH